MSEKSDVKGFEIPQDIVSITNSNPKYVSLTKLPLLFFHQTTKLYEDLPVMQLHHRAEFSPSPDVQAAGQVTVYYLCRGSLSELFDYRDLENM